MSQNAHQGPGNEPGSAAMELPDDLRGPFLREFVPDGPYQHVGLQRAAVVHYRNGGHSIITAQRAEHTDRPRFGKQPVSVCLIARGRHQASFEMQLPSRGDQGSFTCSVDVHWEVEDFFLAAEKRVVDVEKMLRAPLLARLRVLTRRYGLDAAQHCDEAIQAELASGSWAPFGADLGLSTVVYVRIDLGRAATDHRKALLDVQHTAIVQSAKDQADAARVQANLSTARELIAAGEAGQYAYLLAQDPTRAEEVLRELQGQAREQRQGALEYLSRLIDQGVVQRHQVEGQVQRLIDYARATSGTLFDSGLPQPPTALPTSPGVGDPAPGQQTDTTWYPTASVLPPQPPVPPYQPPQDVPPVPPARSAPPVPPAPPAAAGTPAQDDPQPAAVDGKVNYVRQGRRRSRPGSDGTAGGNG
ncbi:hypothetical protein HLK59_23955 [Streptomyces sp. S3(2020)]|uniref:hypothetical protein n=1 Tax=Streptomyces sp. S3(2020) TaxID=2732044 RepID=UPI00148940A8|nr:hypothetical protein [Streptomyces sp. S3(2020)]NNN33359.1 hypothetical protein [Streptomyces sp. S3(2020)]